MKSVTTAIRQRHSSTWTRGGRDETHQSTESNASKTGGAGERAVTLRTSSQHWPARSDSLLMAGQAGLRTRSVSSRASRRSKQRPTARMVPSIIGTASIPSCIRRSLLISAQRKQRRAELDYLWAPTNLRRQSPGRASESPRFPG